MNSTPSPAASMFEKVLRAFETRGITYSDVLGQLRRLLATGAPPKDLLAVLRRRKSTERLPEYAHIEALLLEAEPGAAQSADRDSAPAAASSTVVSTPDPSSGTASSGTAALEPEPPEDEVTVDLDFDASRRELNSPTRLRASELDLSVLAKNLASADERDPPRRVSLEALTRSYERAREGESAAAERATALAADLEAARIALRAEQGKVREREARVAALSQERTALEAALEARAKGAAQLEADLREAHDRAEAATSELRAGRDAAAALDALLKRGGAHLDATHKQPDAEKEQSVLYLEQLRHRDTTNAGSAAVDDPKRSAPRTERDDPRPPAAEAPARRRARWLGLPARALGWGAASVLLAVFAWLFAHRAPPTPAPAAAAARPNPGTVIRDCPNCPKMTVLPAGRFKQGSAGGSAFELPLHWVALRGLIAISTNPVTLEDFGQFAAATGRDMQGCDTYDGEWKQRPGDNWERPGFPQSGMHPVTCVSWNDAEAYAKWLSAKTGHHYRLPSASEWEYAARAGNETAEPWAANRQDACADANVADASAGHRYPGWAVFPCDDGYVYTAPVGAFKANAFGLNDMLGNVLQWTEDCWHENYLGAPVDGSAWVDGDCSLHEIRGGSWFSNPAYVRADYRDRFPADYRASSVGIRLVRDIQP